MKRIQASALALLMIGLTLSSGCSGWISKRALERGTAAMKRGDYATAITQFEKASRYIVDSPDLYYNLGKANQQLNKLDAALRNYETALTLKPSDTDCMFGIGEILLQRQRWDEAIAIYEKASLLLPPDARLLCALAKAATGAGRIDIARIYLVRALRVDPNCATAHYNLGCLYRDTYLLPAEAVEQFDAYCRLADSQDPHLASAKEKIISLKQTLARQAFQLPAGAKRDPAGALKLIAEGDRQQIAKQPAKAEKAYRDALLADPLSQDALVKVALCCKTKNNLPEALKLLQRAANLEPVRQATLLEAAQTAMALKDWTTASHMLNRVLAISPTYAPAYASLAIVRQYQGQKSSARVYAEQFIRLAPPGPDRDRYEAWVKTLPQ